LRGAITAFRLVFLRPIRYVNLFARSGFAAFFIVIPVISGPVAGNIPLATVLDQQVIRANSARAARALHLRRHTSSSFLNVASCAVVSSAPSAVTTPVQNDNGTHRT
jgi:hypothetical protein